MQWRSNQCNGGATNAVAEQPMSSKRGLSTDVPANGAPSRGRRQFKYPSGHASAPPGHTSNPTRGGDQLTLNNYQTSNSIQTGNSSADDSKGTPVATGLRLYSPVFNDGGLIPAVYTGDGLDLSPPLHWIGTPEATKTLCLLMEDPDAPTGTWLHWLLFDIPSTANGLRGGIERRPLLANGARHGRCWGADHHTRIGYFGPLPPYGETHRYRFMLKALNCRLGLCPGANLEQVIKASEGHILGTDTLTGLYGR
jgi:Raf kinase inhibitor-like YbhB/YbcL family protein